MGWIVGVRNTGAAPRLLEWTSGGTRELSVADASLPLDDKNKRYSKYVECDLADFRRLDIDEAKAVTAVAGVPEGVAYTQSLWVINDGSRNIFVPSQVFIHALAASYNIQRSALFAPTGYQLISVLYETEGRLKVTFPTSRVWGRPEAVHELTENVVWTSSFASARRMHSSVLRHALDGRFDIELPRARMTMCFVGQESTSNTFLATRISIASIEPLEAPMAHAMGLVPQRFVLKDADNFTGPRRAGERKPGAPLGKRDGGFDADIFDARFHAPLSEEEWEVVSEIFSKHRGRMLGPGPITRQRIDTILRKRSSGASWVSLTASLGERSVLMRYFATLVKNGCWEAVRAYLVKARGGKATPRSTARQGSIRPAAADSDVAIIAARLTALRVEHLKMSTPRLATLLRVSPKTITAWERGRKPPSPAVAQRLAAIAAELLEGGASSVAWLLEEHGQIATPGA